MLSLRLVCVYENEVRIHSNDVCYLPNMCISNCGQGTTSGPPRMMTKRRSQKRAHPAQVWGQDPENVLQGLTVKNTTVIFVHISYPSGICLHEPSLRAKIKEMCRLQTPFMTKYFVGKAKCESTRLQSESLSSKLGPRRRTSTSSKKTMSLGHALHPNSTRDIQLRSDDDIPQRPFIAAR
jgi:hypothetical protein